MSFSHLCLISIIHQLEELMFIIPNQLNKTFPLLLFASRQKGKFQNSGGCENISKLDNLLTSPWKESKGEHYFFFLFSGGEMILGGFWFNLPANETVSFQKVQRQQSSFLLQNPFIFKIYFGHLGDVARGNFPGDISIQKSVD